MIETFGQAFNNLYANKLRSLLAVLGILVGTAAVVALLSSGKLATEKALAQFKTLGTDLFSVSLYDAKSSNELTPANTLSLTETMKIKQEIPGVTEVAPYITSYGSLAYQGHTLQGLVIGATDDLKRILKLKMLRGGFVSYLDNYQLFCVIGDDIYQQIKNYTHEDPIGTQLWIGGYYFTIIGIVEPWTENAFFNADVNQTIFIPIRTANLLNKLSKINNLILLLKPDANVSTTQKQLEQYLQKRVPDLKLFLRSAKQLISSMAKQSQIFTLLLACIGGISLLVGGIGIMNIMLVSVAERRREIGIRKAIGAKQRDIQLLFLFEAITLALFGGIIGVIAGIVTSLIIAYFAHWDFRIFLLPPIIGFLVSATTGIFSGFYPAYRAAQLDPIAALRYE